MNDKHEKQEWRETRLKGKMAESLVYNLLEESGNEVYAIGYEELLPGLSGRGRHNFIRNTIIGKKISSIPDFFVIDKSKQPHLVEVKFRYDSKWHENDYEKLELFKKNWEEAIIVVVSCSQKPYFRFCQYPFSEKIIIEPIQNFKSFGITDEIIKKFDALIAKYVRSSVMNKKELESNFETEMLRDYKEAQKLGYNATRFLNMFYEFGGVATAKKLLADEKYIQEGIIKLWELSRLDLSAEALVLKPEYRDLFTEAELATAKKRLKELGYNIPKN